MKKDSRYSIRLPESDSKIIDRISELEDVDKSLVVRFCITSSLKLAKNLKYHEDMSPELAFLIEAIKKVKKND